MPIKSAPYFFATCDNCGNRSDYGDFTAYEEPDNAADEAIEAGWTRAGEVFHCPLCPSLDTDEDTEAVA